MLSIYTEGAQLSAAQRTLKHSKSERAPSRFVLFLFLFLFLVLLLLFRNMILRQNKYLNKKKNT